MNNDKPGLGAAYALQTPQDSVRLYRDWAETYDRDFADAMDYRYPWTIAAEFAARARPSDGPVLDIGAGTGLVGAALAEQGDWQIDGLDISAEMLHVAMEKGHYRAVHVADLTQRIDVPLGTYGGLVSAGTFTHGHVGPDALDQLLLLARRDALFVLGINAAVYDVLGFGDTFQRLSNNLKDFDLIERPIYGAKTRKGHENDTALIAVFRKA